MLLLRVLLSIFLASSLCLAQIRIPEGTKVRVRLEQNLSSETAEENEPVQLIVTEAITINNTVVLAQGANVIGIVVQAEPKRRMGRTGKLEFSVERVTAVDNSVIPLRYTVNKKEGGSHAVSTGIITAGVAVVFWPAAPFFLLRHGKEAKLNKGMIFDVFTDQDHSLGFISPTATNLATSSVVTSSQSQLQSIPAAPATPADPAALAIS